LNTPLLRRLELFARLDLLPADPGGDLALACADDSEAALAAAAAARKGWAVRRDRFLAPRLRRLLHPALSATRFLRRVVRLRRAAGRVAPPTGVDAVVVTLLDRPGLGASTAAYRDTYFGDLPARLAEAGERVLVLGFTAGAGAEVLEGLGGERQPVPHLALVSGGDLLAAARAVACPPRLDRSVLPHALPSAILRGAEGPDAAIRGHALLLERALARVLAANPLARVILPGENNAWERAAVIAARTAAPPRPTLGYLHCAVSPAHSKYRIEANDADGRPAPDRLITTGPAARELLLQLGGWNPSHVAAGCALRPPRLCDLPLRPGRRDGSTVLVLLEGLRTMVPLLRWLAAARPFLPTDSRVLVRGHPVLPVEVLAQAAGVALGRESGLEASPPGDLADALAEADLVVYKASSAALSAGYMGIPLVWFDGGEPAADDPLADCRAFKRAARRPGDLAAAWADLKALDDEAYFAERDALRQHILRYFAPEDASTLAPFMRERIASP
jgi:hypothetical protein